VHCTAEASLTFPQVGFGQILTFSDLQEFCSIGFSSGKGRWVKSSENVTISVFSGRKVPQEVWFPELS
jgi:hypothetical protein